VGEISQDLVDGEFSSIIGLTSPISGREEAGNIKPETNRTAKKCCVVSCSLPLFGWKTRENALLIE
jgi:hypothetical protein